MDPAAALQVPAVIEPGQTVEIVFLLGEQTSVDGVRDLVRRYSAAENVERALAATRKWWDEKLGSIQVRTPYLSTDFLLNRWLLYQSLSCRFWATIRAVPIRRSLRIPRPVAGRHGVSVLRAGIGPRAHSA